MPKVEISPQNSILLVSDLNIKDVPDGFHNSIVSATMGCIAIGCRSVDDGTTQIILERTGSYDPIGIQLFSGILNTPSKVLLLSDVVGEVILKIPVTNAISFVEIWASDETEPERIEVLVA
jgi:hypothetical protein